MLFIKKRSKNLRLLITLTISLIITAYSANLGSAPSKLWSEHYPTSGSVTIPAGENVLLDIDLNLTDLSIYGQVICAKQDLKINANWILVGGELQCGTPAEPFLSRLIITLTGNNPAANIMGMGTKFLGAMAGGKILLHGEPRTAWLRLAATAAKGSNQITLATAPDWHVGETIVIASSDYHPDHVETSAIASITGNTVKLGQRLAYNHWCATESFGKRKLTECAEVGLLNRNILIRGDTDSAIQGFGGHMMIKAGGAAKLDGVEFFRMGQKGRIGRYPMHWHLVGEANGQYLKRSSIHNVYNRFLSVHGTHAIQLLQNVGYDTIGHGFYLEDGIETRNLIAGNLGLGIHNAANGKPTASDREASVFWISNPDNIIRNNTAAGSEHSGFWLGFPEHPLGLSRNDAIWPRRTPLREFQNNVSHSNNGRGLFIDGAERADRTTQTTWYEPRETPSDENSPLVYPVFKNFISYKNRQEGVWIRAFAGAKLDGAKLADNWMGAYFANLLTGPSYGNIGYIQNSLIVGESGNKGNPAEWETKGLDGRELPHFWASGDSIRGVEFYDGPMGVRNTLFTNFRSNTQRKAGGLSSLAPNPFWVSSLNSAKAISFVNANRIYLHSPTVNYSGDAFSTFLDEDGSVSGLAGWTIVPKNPVLVTSRCNLIAAWNAYRCPHNYSNFHVYVKDGSSLKGTLLRRNDGVSIKLAGSNESQNFIYANIITNRPHDLQFPSETPKHLYFVVSEQANRAVRLSTAYPTAVFSVTHWGSKVPKAQNLEELTSGGRKYFFDGTRLHLRLVSDNGLWDEVEVKRP